MGRPRRSALSPVCPSQPGSTRALVGGLLRYIVRNAHGLGDPEATAALRSRSHHRPRWLGVTVGRSAIVREISALDAPDRTENDPSCTICNARVVATIGPRRARRASSRAFLPRPVASSSSVSDIDCQTCVGDRSRSQSAVKTNSSSRVTSQKSSELDEETADAGYIRSRSTFQMAKHALWNMSSCTRSRPSL